MLTVTRRSAASGWRRTLNMGWLKKLLRREGGHDKWLAAHPGKESSKSGPPSISAEDEERTRSHMEREMDEQRSKRQQG